MKVLHLGIGYAGKPADDAKIRGVINQANGWARYAPNCWLIATNDTPEVWAKRIREIIASEDSIFVCEVNLTNHQGWLVKEQVDWINNTRKLL